MTLDGQRVDEWCARSLGMCVSANTQAVCTPTKGPDDESGDSAHRRFGPPFSYDGLFPRSATEAPLVRGFFAARALNEKRPDPSRARDGPGTCHLHELVGRRR